MKDLLLQGIYMPDKTRAVLFYLIIMLSLFSIVYPWRMKGLMSRLLLHFPFILALFLIIYEMEFVPRHESIRVDALVLFPCVGLAWIFYLVKLVRFALGKNLTLHSRGTR